VTCSVILNLVPNLVKGYIETNAELRITYVARRASSTDPEVKGKMHQCKYCWGPLVMMVLVYP